MRIGFAVCVCSLCVDHFAPGLDLVATALVLKADSVVRCWRLDLSGCDLIPIYVNQGVFKLTFSLLIDLLI